METFKWKKYKGKTLLWILKNDIEYLKWVISKGYKVSEEIIHKLAELKKAEENKSTFTYIPNDYENQTYGTWQGRKVRFEDLTSNQQAKISNKNFEGQRLASKLYK